MNRKRKASDQPICQYGSSCYRKNPEHRKKFHPDSSAESDLKASDKTLRSSKEKRKASINMPEASNQKDVPLKTTILKDQNASKAPVKPMNSKSGSVSETVGDILNSMPADFSDFWDFCSSIKNSEPAEAFDDIGLHLVGVYDLLSKKIPKDETVIIHTHWRYYYDPPEFQTVIKTDDEDLYHIGYFRDDPSEFPAVLAANSAKIGPKLTVKGDNIFAAVHAEITKRLKDVDDKVSQNMLKIQEKLKQYAKKKKYDLQIISPKVKARQKKVVSSTFHGLGIVVPVKSDVGYRPLPDSDKTLKSILQSIVNAKSEDQRLTKEELLDEIITNVHFGNDEGDFGMGLELGIDLFCFGNPHFHSKCLNFLTIAYRLLKRPKYIGVITAHLANRREGEDLNLLVLKNS